MNSNFTPNSSQDSTPSYSGSANTAASLKSNSVPCLWLKITLPISIAALLYGGSVLFGNLTQNLQDSFYHSPIALSIIALQIITAIGFCIWIQRATINAALFHPEKNLPEPKSVIASFFLPIVQFALPCIYIIQIANASSKRKTYTELVIAWWIAYLAFIISAVVILLPFDQKFIEVAAYGLIIGGIACNFALLILVHMVSGSQIRRTLRAKSRS